MNSYIYQKYAGRYPETSLSILIAGDEWEDPKLDRVTRTASRHSHFLNLRQHRKGREVLSVGHSDSGTARVHSPT